MPTSVHDWYTCTGPAFIFVISISNYLFCMLHLQQTKEVVKAVTTASGKQAVKMVTNICSMQILYSRIVFLCWCTTRHKYVFVNFIHRSIWLFPHIDSKKVCTLIKHSVTKFSVISSIHYTLSFITLFFEEMFSWSRNFYDNNIYYGIIRSGQKWSGKWMVHRLMDTVPRTKTKTLPLRKIRFCYLFRAVYHSKKHTMF